MKHLSKNSVIPLLLFVLFMVSLTACGTAQPTATPTPMTLEESAWYACTLGIKKELGLSILDAQNYNPEGVHLDDTFKDGTPVDFTTYTGPRQYEVDVYYAKVKSMYHCILIYYPDTKAWKLTSLEVQ